MSNRDDYIPIDNSIQTYNYTDIQTAKQKELLQTAFDRWKKLGFLKGIDDEEKAKEVAFAFEQASAYLLYCHFWPSLETISFPIIRKVISNLDVGVYNHIKFWEYINMFNYPSIMESIYDACNKLDIDKEAEMTALIADVIVLKFKNPQESWENVLNKVPNFLGGKARFVTMETIGVQLSN